MSELELEEKRQEELSKIKPIDMVKQYMSQGMDKKEAIKKTAKEFGVNKNEIYKECIDL